MRTTKARFTELSERFRRFAEECREASPLYNGLATRIAEDPDLLAIADEAGERESIPQLYMAAVQHLLAKTPDSALRDHYPSLSGNQRREGDPFPVFRRFCLERAPALHKILRHRLVQTNEVRRTACLLPAFCLVAECGGGGPLAMVELGASAGLLLLWDQYAYGYGETLSCGKPQSAVRIDCTLRGPGRPPLPSALPTLSIRVGVDLNPLDVADPDAVAWLEAIVWPDEPDRLQLLRSAVTLAQANPVRVLGGDALTLLPGILAGLPADCTVCVYRAHTPGIPHDSLARVLSNESTWRELFLVRLGGAGRAELSLSRFANGHREERQLAYCDPHGEWLEWVG